MVFVESNFIYTKYKYIDMNIYEANNQTVRGSTIVTHKMASIMEHAVIISQKKKKMILESFRIR